MDPSDEQRSLDELVERLHQRFPHVALTRVQDVVATAHHQFDGARVRTFVPVLVEHDATEQLA